MHIGLVCSEYPPAVHGGIGSYTRDLARGLLSRGHMVSVVGVYQRKQMAVDALAEDRDRGVRVVRIPPTERAVPLRLRLLLDRWRLTRWFSLDHRQRPYDLIEAPEWGAELLFGGPGQVPIISRIHGGHLFFDSELKRRGSRLIHLFERRWLRRADALAAVSDYVGNRTLQLAGLAGRPYEVIHNAVDASKFMPEDVPVETGLIVFANSIREKKGVIELAWAMEYLHERYPEARVVFIGKDETQKPDGRLISEKVLQGLSPEARQRVTFTGWLDTRKELLDYLRRAQVCCYPSHMEGFGIAPIEAMALAKPTIFTATGPGPEVIEDGVSGMLCDPHDPADIAAKIRCLLDDPVLARRLGEAGRVRVLSCFNRDQWVERNDAFFQSVASRE